MTPERIAEIEKRLEKATKWPWDYHDGDDNGFYAGDLQIGIYAPENADLIANAPTDLRDLLDALREAREVTAIIHKFWGCAKIDGRVLSTNCVAENQRGRVVPAPEA